ncbi:unnamed protein product [Rodentolepis nana]|uniref:RNase NYN domain-containing protein n=1 Tax=Rodentolepis nana TaxID=102285 RepID=A0A158QGF7_RODNA|nr:unnamed protein product [Rodentolepis nana]
MFKTKVLLPPDFSRNKELVQYISQVCHVKAVVQSASRPQLEISAEDQESLHFSQNLALSFVGPELETVLPLSPAILTAFRIVEIQRYFARRHRMVVIAENNNSLYMCGPASRLEAASEVLADVELYSVSLDPPVETSDFEALCSAYDISSKNVKKRAKVEEINFLFYFLPLVESKMDCLDPKSLLARESFDAYRKLNGCEVPKPVSNGTPKLQVSAISTQGKRSSSKRRRHRKKNHLGPPKLNGNCDYDHLRILQVRELMYKLNSFFTPLVLRFTRADIKDRRRRVVVIDGANVAHSESTTRKFSLGNLRIAYNYFVNRGFTEVKIVLPEASNECRQYFSDEELVKHFIFTPIRRLIPGEKPQRADDDR